MMVRLYLSSDAKACFLPEILHAHVLQPHAWYPHRDRIRIQCDEGYEEKSFDATAVCSDGIWTSVPHCESMCHTQPGKSTTGPDSYVNWVKEVISKHFYNVSAAEKLIKMTSLDFSVCFRCLTMNYSIPSAQLSALAEEKRVLFHRGSLRVWPAPSDPSRRRHWSGLQGSF